MTAHLQAGAMFLLAIGLAVLAGRAWEVCLLDAAASLIVMSLYLTIRVAQMAHADERKR